jgi:hypothetical protein
VPCLAEDVSSGQHILWNALRSVRHQISDLDVRIIVRTKNRSDLRC